ncbi:MAG: DegT/DnrJ/EryC1/StrS family aminotransferase [Elusimicrobia bacterium]|nr:DegT/DnrJ/EryC1/StrS family aminotransferase [Elusimicrobiota bacterium]
MKIPMVDVLAGYSGIKDEVETAVRTVMNKGNFILGEEVAGFESEFAALNGSKYAVGVANGTDALRLSIVACGIRPGDEIITTPFTFIATTETISQSGAVPVFADIEPDTYNLDPRSVEKKITSRTRAVIPVHLYGHPADMDALAALAKKRALRVIEDCAQSFTAQYQAAGKEWKFTGAIGDCGAFSFFPAKNLGAFGDGGLVATDDPKIAEELKALRNHGSKVRYLHETEGFNSRLDTIQAAILSVKLKHVLKWTEMRNAVAAKYRAALKDVCAPAVVRSGCRHSFNYYTVRFKSKAARDAAQKHLSDNGIANQIYYPVALHQQPAYGRLGYKKGDLPVCEQAQDEVFSLPMYPELSDEQIRTVTDAVKEAVLIK